ncbi:MAG: HEAT repeat domain-containing protein [Pirellulaceae bacterium]|nr:HEAT repeat domain-containing protein [Pirellulaceae bacterium]
MNRRTMLMPLAAGVTILAQWLSAAVCWADRFQLKDGRLFSGSVVKADTVELDERQQTRWTVEIEPGVIVRIQQSDMNRNGHVGVDEREAEYQQKIVKLPDTADAHYRAAQWCSQQGLHDLARAHYLRTIDLNPEHKEARAAVKHTRSSDSGRWVKRDDVMSNRGKVFHEGKWKFPEYIPMDEAVQDEAKRRAQLQKEITRWHHDAATGSGEKAQQALAYLSQVDNPLAIEYVSQLLLDKQKSGQPPATALLKQTYIGVLNKFDSPSAAVTLAQVCVNDALPAVRNAALDALGRGAWQSAMPVLVSYLRHANNELVNRAGFALGQLNAQEAILPLIEALSTKHEFQTAGNTNYSPTAGGLSMGGPKKRTVELNNDRVHSALAQITGQGQLGFDKSGWKAWYASVYAPPVDDLRRDP